MSGSFCAKVSTWMELLQIHASATERNKYSSVIRFEAASGVRSTSMVLEGKPPGTPLSAPRSGHQTISSAFRRCTSSVPEARDQAVKHSRGGREYGREGRVYGSTGGRECEREGGSAGGVLKRGRAPRRCGARREGAEQMGCKDGVHRITSHRRVSEVCVVEEIAWTASM